MEPLDTMIDAMGDGLKKAKCFKGDPNCPAPFYFNGGWLVADWITPERLKDPEVIEFLKESGFIKEDSN
jgi:hypothetical protein